MRVKLLGGIAILASWNTFFSNWSVEHYPRFVLRHSLWNTFFLHQHAKNTHGYIIKTRTTRVFADALLDDRTSFCTRLQDLLGDCLWIELRQLHSSLRSSQSKCRSQIRRSLAARSHPLEVADPAETNTPSCSESLFGDSKQQLCTINLGQLTYTLRETSWEAYWNAGKEHHCPNFKRSEYPITKLSELE